MKHDLMRRSSQAFAAVAAVCLLTSQAAFAQYKFKVVVSAAEFGGATYQASSLNNNGQCSFNIVGSEKDAGDDGETTYVYDGANVIRVQPVDSPKLPDGATIAGGSHWSPHGINNNGKMAFVADTSGSPHAILVYNIADKSYTMIANNATKVEGGTLTSGGVALEGRMICEINDKDQVVWSEGLAPADGSDANDAVFMFDPAANKYTTVARKGTALPGGKTVLNALFPTINNNGDVVFMANTTDNETFGVYQYSGGNITAICTPGTVVDGVTVAQAKLPRNSVTGVVFRGETVSSGAAAPVADDTGYFLFANGKLSKIIAPGDALPGGKKFVATEAGGGRKSCGINNNGQVAFKAVMENDESGIYVWKDGQFTPAVVSGQTVEAAGTVGSVTQGVGDNSGYHMGFNDFGDVFFSGVIDGNNAMVIATAPR